MDAVEVLCYSGRGGGYKRHLLGSVHTAVLSIYPCVYERTVTISVGRAEDVEVPGKKAVNSLR